MIKTITRILPLALGFAISANADHHEHNEAEHAGSPESGASLFTATFLGNYNFTTGKIIQLAEAIPADKYTWAPAEGIRSVEKTILHIAGANYMLGSKLGAMVPEDIDPMTLEKGDHDKAAAIETLKSSLAFVKHAISQVPEAELGDEVEMFGMQLNNMSVALIVGGHANEHLGQLIAYARSMGVAPPWSQ